LGAPGAKITFICLTRSVLDVDADSTEFKERVHGHRNIRGGMSVFALNISSDRNLNRSGDLCDDAQSPITVKTVPVGHAERPCDPGARGRDRACTAGLDGQSTGDVPTVGEREWPGGIMERTQKEGLGSEHGVHETQSTIRPRATSGG